jgi:hypothetical protein
MIDTMNDTTAPHAPHPLACPCCRSLDRTEQVSAVYSAGCSTSRSTGVAGTFDGQHWYPTPTVFGMATQQQSLLSQRLAPPVPPRQGSMSAVLTLLALGLGSVAGCAGLGVMAQGSLGDVVAGLVLLLLAGGFAAVIGLAALNEGRNEQTRMQAAQAAYQRACSLYAAAVYCHRCDGVWVPGAGQVVPAGQMQAALYYVPPTTI